MTKNMNFVKELWKIRFLSKDHGKYANLAERLWKNEFHCIIEEKITNFVKWTWKIREFSRRIEKKYIKFGKDLWKNHEFYQKFAKNEFLLDCVENVNFFKSPLGHKSSTFTLMSLHYVCITFHCIYINLLIILIQWLISALF